MTLLTPAQGTINDEIESIIPFVRSVASKCERNRDLDDSDVFGDALLKVVKAAKRFDPERGIKFVTFAGSHLENTLRRNKKQREKPSEYQHFSVDDCEVISAEDSRIDPDLLEALRNSLAELTDQQRAVLTMAQNRRSFRDIGRELRMSYSKAQRIYRDALAVLRERLEVLGFCPDDVGERPQLPENAHNAGQFGLHDGVEPIRSLADLRH